MKANTKHFPSNIFVFIKKTKQDINMISYYFALKQPSRGVLKKKCSENMQEIYRKTLMHAEVWAHFGMGNLL